MYRRKMDWQLVVYFVVGLHRQTIKGHANSVKSSLRKVPSSFWHGGNAHNVFSMMDGGPQRYEP